MTQTLLEKLTQEKTIAIIRGIPDHAGDATAQALAMGGIAVGLGSKLVDVKSVQEGNFATIELRARAFVDKVKGLERL